MLRNPGKHTTARLPEARAKPVGLKVLSDHLGLSLAAISRVLSASPAARSIPKETQDRILAAAERLNYRPNLFARSFAQSTESDDRCAGARGERGVYDPGAERNRTSASPGGLLLFSGQPSSSRGDDSKIAGAFQDRAVEGIIAVDTLLRERWAMPTVSVSGHHEPKGVTNIVLNHRLAAALAVDHLRGLGHRRLAFIKGQRFSSDTESRWRGIRHV